MEKNSGRLTNRELERALNSAIADASQLIGWTLANMAIVSVATLLGGLVHAVETSLRTEPSKPYVGVVLGGATFFLLSSWSLTWIHGFAKLVAIVSFLLISMLGFAACIHLLK